MNRILVIDDDVQMRQMLKQMLEREGYEVVDASDGAEGIKLYHLAPTDLIITDIIMPEKEGIETIIELKRDFPDVKIIAMSGGSRNLNPQNCLYSAKRLGAAYTFSKPFERKEFLGAVQKLLSSDRHLNSQYSDNKVDGSYHDRYQKCAKGPSDQILE